VLLNQVIAGFTNFPNLPLFTSLDIVLAKPAATRKSGGGFGIRVGYAISPRFTAEVSVDGVHRHLKLTDDLLTGVEASRGSFTSAFGGIISTGGGVIFVNPTVTSVATIHDDSGTQVVTIGALRINLASRGRVAPYATIGAGVVSDVGDRPSIALVGNYRFTLGGINPVNETDAVDIRVATDKRAFSTSVGGGARILGSSRWGVRADVRAYFTKNTVKLLLDAHPQVAVLTPAGFIASSQAFASAPSIQFSNNPSTGRPSSLSGPAIGGFEAFSGSGTQVGFTISAGYFVRF
jgi:hypothetical protein